MSKRRRKTSRPNPSTRRRESKSSTSWVIPVVVGVVVVAILAGAIASLAKDQSAVANSASGPVATAQPLGSQSIPNPEVPRISLEETTGKLEQGQAVLIDVRSSESFAKSHAAGAISMPESEIEARLQELPRDKDLVLY